jgi:hypothetical protein
VGFAAGAALPEAVCAASSPELSSAAEAQKTTPTVTAANRARGLPGRVEFHGESFWGGIGIRIGIGFQP